MDRFHYLLERYLDNTATEHEITEFFLAIQDNDNDEMLERVMDEKLARDSAGLHDDERLEVLHYIMSTRRRPVRKRYWLAAAGISAIILLTLGLAEMISSLSRHPSPAGIVAFNGKNYVSLPDGSKVTLKEGSRLTYKESFGKHSREVTLSGEAFFDVASDHERAFKVHTGAITTTVVGTAFNVNASGPGREITVTVTRGKVAVGDETHTEILQPNEQLTINIGNTNEFSRRNVNADSILQWTDEYFILDRVTMEEAAVMIGLRFQTKVIIENNALKDCVISAWFLNNEDLHQVVEAISAVRRANTTFRDGLVVIDGGVACDP